MTITSDPSAPLVVIVGATGVQGGSVIRNLIQSDKPYRLRGLTRDATKPVAQELKSQGVDVVAVSIAVGNEAAVREAFRGADVVFAMTNIYEHWDAMRETDEGKLMADAAKAVGVKLFIFSGLVHVSKLSGGKYTNVKYYDSKAEVVEYARSQLPTVDVQAGFYMTNLANPLLGPKKLDDGTYEWQQLNEAGYSYIDMDHDFGLFVRYAIESPEYNKGGGTIHTHSEHLTTRDAAAILERVRGYKVKVVTAPSLETGRIGLESLGFPPQIAAQFIEGAASIEEFGQFFGLEKSEEQQKVRASLPRKPRTFEEFLKANTDFLKA